MKTTPSTQNQEIDIIHACNLLSRLDRKIQKEKKSLFKAEPLKPVKQEHTEFAEKSLLASLKAFEAISLLLSTSLDITREANNAMLGLKTTIKNNDSKLIKKDIALQTLRKVNKDNKNNLKASSVAFTSLEELAFKDPLTSLPNRRLLMDRLDRAFINNARKHKHGAVLFFDLDHFKQLNDSYGHEAGDALLIEVGKRLQSCVRQSDTVGRYGGDEFVIILSELPNRRIAAIKKANWISHNILTRLCEPYYLNVSLNQIQTVIEHQCFVSVGVAMFSDEITIKAHIIDFADEAMYRAKKEGGKSICFHDYDETFNEQSTNSINVVGDSGCNDKANFN